MRSRFGDLVLRRLAFAGRWLGRGFDRACRVESCRRILVFQAGGIGDVIRIFPLILSLRHRFPNASLVTLTPFADTIFRLFPVPQAVTESLLYDLPGRHRGLLGKWRLVQELRRYAFDLVVNPARGEGMLQNAILVFATEAPCRVGFDHNGAGFLNTVKVQLRADRPIVQQNLDLLRALGISPEVEGIVCRIPHEDLAFADSLVRECLRSGERLVALHAGSHWREHLRWPLSRYISLAEEMLRAYACRIVLLGTKEETILTQEMIDAVRDPRLINLAGKTTLTQAAAILSRSDLFIGNDSGLLHVALALRVPTIGIFGYTSPRQVISPEGPCIALWKETGGGLYLHQPFFEFNPEERNPLELIEVAEVLQAVKRLLDAPLPHVRSPKTSV